MIGFALARDFHERPVQLKEEVQYIHAMKLRTPAKEALVVFTRSSLFVYTPDDNVMHPANHMGLEVLHVLSDKGCFTVITPTGQHTFTVARKDSLFSIINTKGSLFPTLTDTRKFSATIVSACGTHQIFLLHSDGNLTLLKPRPHTYTLGLPLGRIEACRSVIVIRSEEGTHIVKFNEKNVLDRRDLPCSASVAVDDQYIYVGTTSTKIDVYDANQALTPVGSIDIREFGVMGDFNAVWIRPLHNGSLIVQYERLGFVIFNKQWVCTSKLFSDRKLGRGMAAFIRGTLWAYEEGTLCSWEVQEYIPFADTNAVQALVGRDITILKGTAMEHYKVCAIPWSTARSLADNVLVGHSYRSRVREDCVLRGGRDKCHGCGT